MKLNWKFTIVIIAAVTIPIAIFAGILFYNLEQSTVSENRSYMEYKMDKNAETMYTCMDSVNMSTQFFLSDEQLLEMLARDYSGETVSTQELVDFQKTDIKNLERLVSNNPLLYSVRVYSVTNTVQEMMPILYRHNRMENLDWAATYEAMGTDGWKFGYADTTFSQLVSTQTKDLAGYVTPVVDYRLGTIGTIEAVVPMKNLFPGLYEKSVGEWGCFVAEDGNVYYGSNYTDEAGRLQDKIWERVQQEHGDADGQDSFVSYYKLGGRKLIVTAYRENELGGTILGIKDITAEIQKVYDTRAWFIGGMIVLLIGVAFIINWIVSHMLRQFYEILRSMRAVEKGDLSVRIAAHSKDEMGELGSQLNKMLDRIQDIMEENINREVLVKNSEIRALQNQINAHFIYNVLESIKMMAEIDEEYEISDAITSLGRLLRYSMKWTSKNVLLKDEMDYIRDYMALINLRYDFTVTLSTNIPEELMKQEIPKMSLQPVVENAILHGIEPLGVDSTIYIKAWMEEEDCIIEISDAGQGMTDAELKILTDRLQSKVEKAEGKGGIGLKNVHDRIGLEFGPEYGLQIFTRTDCYTKVRIKLPGKQNTQEE